MGRRGFLRLYRDRPDLLTPVIWYIVPYDRPELGVPTIFGNRQWELELFRGELGDDASGRSFYGGPAPVAVAGCGRVGSDDQWLNGCLTTDPVPPRDPTTGAPVGCCGRHFLGLGGGAAGAPDPTHFLLQESEGRILTETGARLLWE